MPASLKGVKTPVRPRNPSFDTLQAKAPPGHDAASKRHLASVVYRALIADREAPALT
jgi:hypothetical protein